VTVTIVGSSGSGAFSPNPASATTGQTLAFKNNDLTAHRIVSNAGGYDTGNVAPGATSPTMTVSSGGAQNFHCTIHPTMVFAVNGSAPPPEPTPNPSGGYDY
jgi:plastocyanin